jgi:hypothetical protein
MNCRGVEDEPGSEVVFYQWDKAGAYQRIEESFTPSPPPSDHIPKYHALVEQWKGQPTLIDHFKGPQFDEMKDIGLLRFWTSVATVSICINDDKEGAHVVHSPLSTAYPRGSISNQPNNPYRDIIISHISAPPSDSPKAANMAPDLTCTTHHQTCMQADLVIVRRVVSMDWVSKVRKYDTLQALIVSVENGIASRIGLAMVPETAWVALSNRRWEMVTLG